jgi:15-cis-phytoene synthase
VAVAAATSPREEDPKLKVKPIEDRVVWVIDLFTRLERHYQLLRSGSLR